MRVDTKEFKKICQTILYAIDNKSESVFASTLELVVKDRVLNLNVTNREYYVSVKLNIDYDDEFRAAVNATTFLKLISKFTTENIELIVNGNVLNVIANGNYSIPMIFNGDSLLELPVIELSNEITNEQTIPYDILSSIVYYNTKEMQRGNPNHEWSRYHYVDEQGAITAVTGACVNSFTLANPIKLLLTDQVVKLFKLFTTDVNIKLSQEATDTGRSLTKLLVCNDSIKLVTKLIGMTDSSLIGTFPVSACRSMASTNYTYSTVISKSDLLAAIDRLKLLSADEKIGKLKFTFDGTTSYLYLLDRSENNSERLVLTKDFTTVVNTYDSILNLDNLQSVLSTCDEEYLTVCFGNHRTMVFKRGNVSDILSEGH